MADADAGCGGAGARADTGHGKAGGGGTADHGRSGTRARTAAGPALWAAAATLALALALLTRATGSVPVAAAAAAAVAGAVAVALVAARTLPRPVGGRTALLAAPAVLSLSALSLPVRRWTPGLSVPAALLPALLVLLVLAGCLMTRRQRAGGALVGVAAALQPAALLFALLLHLTGRGRAAVTAGVTFAACAVLAGTVPPYDAYAHLAHLPPADGLADPSLRGALDRLGATGPRGTALLLVLGGAVAALGLRRAVRYARDGQPLLALAVTGCAAAVVAPTPWPHLLLWLPLTMAGRVGRHACDRPLWPFAVVLVTTLPGTALLPDVTVLHPLRENLVLLAALAAATAVRFLPRTSPHHRSPVPVEHTAPPPAGRTPRTLLRPVPSRPNLLLELLLIRLAYAAYAQVRHAVSGGRGRAEEHGREILRLERFLRLDVERAVNGAVLRADRLRGFFDVYYTSFHFAVPLAVLGVLYWRRPADYRWARSALGLGTLFALLGFWLYPLAPPRLMPGLGIVDTVHGAQDLARPDYGTLTALTNPYAAMPSLHFGWALWCGVVVVVLAPRAWLKALGLLHPLCTAGAIVATGNHWVLDAAGGALVIGAGFGLLRVLRGRGPGRTARAGAGQRSGVGPQAEAGARATGAPKTAPRPP
ncbi:MAG TPA: phosphatase PAP2 family protein [Streptomyces sp.]|nr:phosphatase PAP2 family protein [Streptomyces sp.]